jgi:hypothetical protein
MDVPTQEVEFARGVGALDSAPSPPEAHRDATTTGRIVAWLGALTMRNLSLSGGLQLVVIPDAELEDGQDAGLTWEGRYSAAFCRRR